MPYTPTNFHRALQSHSVLLITKNGPFRIATGTLILYNNLFLVLTVAHILEGVKPEELLIHLGISGQRYPMKKEKIWKDEKLDVAYIQLNTFEAKIFLDKFVPLIVRQTVPRDVAQPSYRCTLLGYPDDMAVYKEDSKIVQAETLLVSTQPLTPEQWLSGIREDGKDPKINFLLKYGPKNAGKFVNHEGQTATPTSPFGLSGAGVWLYDPATEMAQHPQYALFGIQTGFYKSDQLLVGTIIEPLFKQIHLDFGPNLDEY